MEFEKDNLNLHRGEFEMPKVDVTKVTDGLGVGEGTISYSDRVDEVGPEKIQAVEAAIVSKELLVPVDTDKTGQIVDDDGCGDGRVWVRVFEGTVEKFRSLRRAKVFGAGPAMATASSIGLGDAKNTPLQTVFSRAIGTLKRSKIDFGGHTDNTHNHGPNCGCGALDKAPVVVANVAKYDDHVKSTISALGISDDGLDEVVDNYTAYADEIHGQEYAGSAVMDEIIKSGKIVKELDGTHNEMFIILNDVEGYTIDQDKVRELSDGDIQVFVVDVWRLKDIANRLYADSPEKSKHKAFLSMLAYTLGVAATLTKGDLPVYAIAKQPELAAA